MKGKAILHYSDYSCVVKALQDGSTSSDVLQEQALELWQLTSRFGILLLSGWVPGDRVIDQTDCHDQAEPFSILKLLYKCAEYVRDKHA